MSREPENRECDHPTDGSQIRCMTMPDSLIRAGERAMLRIKEAEEQWPQWWEADLWLEGHSRYYRFANATDYGVAYYEDGAVMVNAKWKLADMTDGKAGNFYRLACEPKQVTAAKVKATFLRRDQGA